MLDTLLYVYIKVRQMELSWFLVVDLILVFCISVRIVVFQILLWGRFAFISRMGYGFLIFYWNVRLRTLLPTATTVPYHKPDKSRPWDHFFYKDRPSSGLSSGSSNKIFRGLLFWVLSEISSIFYYCQQLNFVCVLPAVKALYGPFARQYVPVTVVRSLYKVDNSDRGNCCCLCLR